MSSLKKLIASVLVASSVIAAVIPTTTISVSSILKITTASELLATPTINCDHSWCQNSTSMCVYWAGVTGYDVSLGPIPGETVTQLGSCTSPATTENIEPYKSQNNQQMFITPAPTAPVDCSYQYCDGSTSYCMYWAGVTGYNISLGPVPGMTRTLLGSCQAPISNRSLASPPLTPINVVI